MNQLGFLRSIQWSHGFVVNFFPFRYQYILIKFAYTLTKNVIAVVYVNGYISFFFLLCIYNYVSYMLLLLSLKFSACS